MQDITLTLNADEVNIVLAALSKFPFEAVSKLIPKIIEQGQSQIKAE